MDPEGLLSSMEQTYFGMCMSFSFLLIFLICNMIDIRQAGKMNEQI